MNATRMNPGDRVAVARCNDCDWVYVHPDLDRSAAEIELRNHHRTNHCCHFGACKWEKEPRGL